MKKALITGVPGFAGSHLARELLNKGYQITGTYFPDESLKNIEEIQDQIKLYPLDLSKPDTIKTVLRKTKPEYLYHLAAQPSVSRSFKKPEETYEVNFRGTWHLLEQVKSLKKLKGLLLVSSADIYGVVKQKELPITVDSRLQPVSPYGISKAACDMMGYQYFRRNGIPIIRVRSFNHSGPNQKRGFVIPDICYQIARFERNSQKGVLKVGNIDVKRDISDVRDIVRGYRLALEKGKPGEVYLFCTGQAYKIRSLINKLIKMSDKDFDIRKDSNLYRLTDVPILRGDISRTEKKLGYKRKYSIDDTLRDCLNYYRSL